MHNSLMLLLGAALVLPPAAAAQNVGLAGILGSKALILVDNHPPKAVAPGESYKGVHVVAAQGNEATIEIEGKRQTLRIGEAPASVGLAPAEGAASRIVLTGGSGGHFVTQGLINGKTLQMVVDTGATAVSLSTADAQRIGLKYEGGQPVRIGTANGIVIGWRVTLASVRVGDVTAYQVDAVVSPGAMPYVLLGNSFLTRFQMTRTNDQMILEKRF